MSSVPDADNAYARTDQQHLRLVECADCIRLERAMQAMGIDIQNLEADVKAKNRQLGKLKAEIARERREGPFNAEAQILFEYWQKTCRPEARAFGEDRLKAVLSLLNLTVKVPGQKTRERPYPPRYVAEAIKGASLDPKPWHDLAWICKNTQNLEGCHRAYEAWRDADARGA